MKKTTEITPLGYRADIDGLRALAVMAVVAYHANLLGATGGFVGVDVFFVISGYLITQHLSSELKKTGSLSFLKFYARRVRRLFPAVVFLMVSVLAIWAFLLLGVPDETHALIKSMGWSLFGSANLFFKEHTGGYFDAPSTQMPMLHFWSLGVEEQFYLVWPLVLWMGYRWKKLKGILLGLMILALVSFALSLGYIHFGKERAAFYWMPPRAWELALGGCLAFVPTTLIRSAWVSAGIAAMGLGLILWSSFYYSVQTMFPGIAAIPPVMGAFFLVLSGSCPNPVTRVFQWKPLVRVGILSYGWYLWHWPLLAMAKVYRMGSEPPAWIKVVLIGVALIMAMVSLRWVEKPVRFGKRFSKLSSRGVFAYAGVACACLAALAMGLLQGEKTLIGSRNADFVNRTEERFSIVGKCGIDRPENEFTDRCTLQVNGSDRAPERQIIIWGDSHAMAYFPMLEAYARDSRRPTRLVLYERSAFLPILSDRAWLMNEETTHRVRQLNQEVMKHILGLVSRFPRNSVSVVLAARWMQFAGEKPISVVDQKHFLSKNADLNDSLKNMEDGLTNTLKALNELGVRVLLLLPYPEFKYYSLPCHVRAAVDCDTPRSIMESYRARVTQVLVRSASKFKNVKVVDPMIYLCDSERCPQVIQENDIEIPATFDDDHPSASAARVLAKKFLPELNWLTSFKPRI